MLPAIKKHSRPRIDKGIRRVWPRHKAFVRKHQCVVTLTRSDAGCEGSIEAAHYRTAANSGKDLKPGDWFTFPCCHLHHAEQHITLGQDAFQAKYGLDLPAICAEFARKSTDVGMREYLREREGVKA